MDSAISIVRGCLQLGATGERDIDGSLYYSWKCPYCGEVFVASSRHLRNRTKRGGAHAHCGCQTKLRQSQKNRGRIPPNKLDDRAATVRLVHRACSAKLCTLSEEDVEGIIFERCHYCGELPNHYRTLGSGKWRRVSTVPSNGVDRRDSSVGYIPDNCLPCCTKCNYMKRDYTYEEFVTHIKQMCVNLNL